MRFDALERREDGRTQALVDLHVSVRFNDLKPDLMCGQDLLQDLLLASEQKTAHVWNEMPVLRFHQFERLDQPFVVEPE